MINITEEVSNIRKAIKNIEITVEQCDICDRSILQRLLNEGADHVLVLSNLNCNSESSDAKTLLILLQLRDISQKLNMNFSIISEMVDVRNQELAKITNVDDFVISGSITSLMITQISENRYLAPIFEDLYDSEGSEFHLKPVINYVKVGEPTNFYNITHCVSKSGEIPVGYKRVCKDTHGRSISEIYINPEKNKEILFTEEDYLIVLAEK